LGPRGIRGRAIDSQALAFHRSVCVRSRLRRRPTVEGRQGNSLIALELSRDFGVAGVVGSDFRQQIGVAAFLGGNIVVLTAEPELLNEQPRGRNQGPKPNPDDGKRRQLLHPNTQREVADTPIYSNKNLAGAKYPIQPGHFRPRSLAMRWQAVRHGFRSLLLQQDRPQAPSASSPPRSILPVKCAGRNAREAP
jgi:hypothetical protein